AGALWRVWGVRGHLRGGRGGVGVLPSLRPGDEPAAGGPHAAAAAPPPGGAGGPAPVPGEYVRGRVLCAGGLGQCRRLGDTQGIAGALHKLGNLLFEQGEYAQAQTLLEESLVLSRTLDDEHSIATSLYCLGVLAWRQGDTARARVLYEESLTLNRA